MLENSPYKVLVRNTANVKIAEDVTSELILDRLVIQNCAKVFCSEEQESAIAVIAENVATIGEQGMEEISQAVGSLKDLFSTRMINAVVILCRKKLVNRKAREIKEYKHFFV